MVTVPAAILRGRTPRRTTAKRKSIKGRFGAMRCEKLDFGPAIPHSAPVFDSFEPLRLRNRSSVPASKNCRRTYQEVVVRPRTGSGPETPKLEDRRNGHHVARCASELEESVYSASRQRVLTLRSLEAAEGDRPRLRTRRHVRACFRSRGPSPGKSSDKFPRKGINKPWLKGLTRRPSRAARRSREPKYLIRPRSR